MLDILIKNGTLIDGTGRPMYRGDIAVKGDTIEAIGAIGETEAEQVIDAKGCYVAPGFIDVNNHSDTYWRIFLNPGLESLVYQGITTIVGGNCGSSLAPLVDEESIKSIQKWADIQDVNLNWLKMDDFLNEVERKKLSVNFATLVGHGTLRRGLVRDEVRPLADGELKAMKKMLKEAMKDGAVGLSTGLVYTHAKQATERELMELLEIVKKYDGIYTTHIREESGRLVEAVGEAIRLAQESGVRLQISHLKVMGEKNWHLMDEAINLVETARTSGVDVSFDMYPYTMTGSVLYILLPDWVAEGGKKMMLERLKNPAIRAKVIAEMKAQKFDYDKITISISPLNKELTHKRIVDIASARGKSVEEAIIDILIASDARVITMMEVLSEKNMIKVIQHPFSIISSNGSGYNLEHRDSGETVHPRNFGSFPRVLARYVKAQRVLSWEEAVWKMTGKPAEKFRLKKRGVLQKGNLADIVVFDPATIADLATTENPYQYSEGIQWVLVNGKVALKEGVATGMRSGEVVKRKNFW